MYLLKCVYKTLLFMTLPVVLPFKVQKLLLYILNLLLLKLVASKMQRACLITEIREYVLIVACNPQQILHVKWNQQIDYLVKQVCETLHSGLAHSAKSKLCNKELFLLLL